MPFLLLYFDKIDKNVKTNNNDNFACIVFVEKRCYPIKDVTSTCHQYIGDLFTEKMEVIK